MTRRAFFFFFFFFYLKLVAEILLSLKSNRRRTAFYALQRNIVASNIHTEERAIMSFTWFIVFLYLRDAMKKLFIHVVYIVCLIAP